MLRVARPALAVLLAAGSATLIGQSLAGQQSQPPPTFRAETNIIEVYVRYLREKIEDSPSTPRLIQTVRGVGYVLKG